MKILILIPTLGKGGAEAVAATLSREFALRHETYIGLFDASPETICYPYGGQLLDLGLPSAVSLPSKWMNLLRRIARLREVIKEQKPDRIISLTTTCNFPALFAAILCGCRERLVLSERVTPSIRPWTWQIAMTLFYRFAGLTTLNASDGCSYFVQRLKFPGKKMKMIPNPIDFDLVAAKLAEPVPRTWDDEVPVIAAAGRLKHPQKGFELLLEAFTRVLEQQPARLVIYGEGHHRAALEAQITTSKLTHAVALPGVTDNLYACLQQAQVFILPSRFEGMPNVLLEAMSVGLPVIATDCPTGPREILEDGKNGVLVPNEDVAAMTAAMLDLLGDTQKRTRLGGLAQQRARDYDLATIAEMWLSPGSNREPTPHSSIKTQ